MNRKILLVSVGILLATRMAYAQGPDSATEIESLKRTVQEQNELILQLLQRIEALESKQEKQEIWIEEKEEEEPSWTEHVRVSGDFRYRYEWVDDDRVDADRNRNRIKARIGVDAKFRF